MNTLLEGLLTGLDENFSSLEASRPWLCYWMLHSLSLLKEKSIEEDANLAKRVIYTLTMCRNERTGGFGGGKLQMSHTAPTYAAVMALVTINTREAFETIQRGRLYRFLLSLSNGNGAFRVHQDGECDTRGLYTVLAVAAMTNMLTPELTRGCAEWIRKTQGFDGGIGGEPGNESHGGYAYCGIAALVLLNRPDAIDLKAFARWLYMRQMQIEGGFQGRTNKLVDSCYSFWQGACFSLLNRLDPSARYPDCDALALATYVTGACAHGSGGMKDKPNTHRDFYHTCYSLSGVSVVLSTSEAVEYHGISLKPTDPVFNVTLDKLERAYEYFGSLPNTHEELIKLSI
jgi:protein farnesyltransferase subunit beta